MARLRITLLALIVLLAAGGARAAVFEPGRITYDAAIITQDDRSDLYRIAVSPEFIRGSFSAIVTANFIMDNEGRLRDEGNDFIVLDSMQWNRDRMTLRYGDLENVTLGRGFIVNHYYSNTTNNNPDNETKGIYFDTFSERAHFTIFGTLSHLFAARAERKLGKHLNVGATVTVDSDPADLEIYGLDAKFKIFPNRWTIYTEAADIAEAGTGFVVGTALTPMHKAMDLTIIGEYRKFDSDFAPGLVDEHYEAKPLLTTVQANTGGKIEGFYVAADFSAGNRNSVKLFYEDYEAMRARVGMEASAHIGNLLDFSLFYAQENFIPSGAFRKEDSVVLGRLTMPVAKRLDLVLDYYRAFDDHDQPLESFSSKVVYHRKR